MYIHTNYSYLKHSLFIRFTVYAFTSSLYTKLKLERCRSVSKTDKKGARLRD